jgi:carboxyl-terminal processing protease
MYDPQSSRRNRLFLVLLLLAAFALGVQAEQRGWLPRGRGQEPADARKTFQPFWESWYYVHHDYVDPKSVNNERMTQWAILGMLASLGDTGHTTYLTHEEVQRLKENLKGELEGIGATITLRKQGPTIVQTMPKSPARQAGLKAGDVILQVDNTGVSGLSLQQLVQHIKGPAGSTVRLKVLRGDRPKPIDLEIQRAKIDIPDVSWQMLPTTPPLVHVAIRSFGEHTNEQLRDALAAARQEGARGLILDLRGNPGGLKEQAIKVTSEFLKAGDTVFIERDRDGKQTPVPADPDGIAADIPMCVLINDGTASSSEILAGAIQDHQRGKLIGERTFGTGTVLRQIVLSDGSALLLAVDEWLTPKERQIWHKGIEPDIKVELPSGTSLLLPESGTKLSAKALADSKDTQLLKAIEVMKEELGRK